jgi:hypothetical protein
MIVAVQDCGHWVVSQKSSSPAKGWESVGRGVAEPVETRRKRIEETVWNRGERRS